MIRYHTAAPLLHDELLISLSLTVDVILLLLLLHDTGESALMYCVGREGRAVPSAQVAFAVKLLKRGADRYVTLYVTM
jgi:hypothetical protein